MEPGLIIFLVFLSAAIIAIVISEIKKRKRKKEEELPNFLPENPPKKLRGASFNYFPFKRGRDYWKPLVDMLAEYKFNHTRIIAFGADGADWKADQADWYPWKGGWKDDPSNLDPDKVAEMIYFLKYCASKGIVVQVDFILNQNRLWWDDLMNFLQDGNYNRPIVQYLAKLTNILKDAVNGRVIIGCGNEAGGEEPYNRIQEAVWKAITNPLLVPTATWTAIWHTHFAPATYVTMHGWQDCEGHHCCKGITSTDHSGTLKYLIHNGHGNLKDIMSQIVRCPQGNEGYEHLLMYVKNGSGEISVFTKEEILAEWQDVLEYNRNLL